jgi:hypothetical protein
MKEHVGAKTENDVEATVIRWFKKLNADLYGQETGKAHLAV